MRFRIKPKRELFPYQEKAVNYLRERGKRGGALFMEMRLGKSLTILRFLGEYMRPTKRVLIISPKSVLKSWENELKKEYMFDYEILVGKNREEKIEKLNNGAQYILVNFESVERLDLGSIDWGAVVLDESYRIHNPRSGITKYMLKHFTHVKYKYILCGNPIPENQMNIISQAMFMQNTLYGHDNFYSFRVAYYDKSPLGYDWDPKPGTKALIYSWMHRNCYVLKRKDVNMGSAKVYERRYTQLEGSQKTSYNKMLKRFEADEVSTNLVITQALYLSMLASGLFLTKEIERFTEGYKWHNTNKIKLLIELLTGELKGDQVIVWCRFLNEIREITKQLSENNISNFVIDGSVPIEDRENFRLNFHANKYQVAIMQIQTGKVGLDFSCADTAIYYSNDYSCDARVQSEDRVVHPQKTTPVLIIDLLTENTIDEDVLDLLKEKSSNSALLMSKLLTRIKEQQNGV
jgi:SNF2 family DNA or RNA helicase